jgi:hypothetical protein
MGNRWHIPKDAELCLRKEFRVCAYCRRRMKSHRGAIGSPRDKATFEHLNRNGPFYWTDGLQMRDVVIVCSQCNSSRGQKRLSDWFESTYCQAKQINATTVAPRVREYLRSKAARR